jgi:hypothetical protein
VHLTPTISDLKADRVLVAHAQQMTEDISFTGAGTDFSTHRPLKRGLYRSGGDIAPSRRVPWPQDFVADGGITKLMYKDLDIFQWMEGYISILERESDLSFIRLMLTHFRALMRDAQGHGWELTRAAHGVVLDCIERGEFDWSDELKVAECRRSAITTKLNILLKQHHTGEFRDNLRFNNNNAYQGGASNNRQSNKTSRPLIKICDFYNKGVCSHRADHRNGNVYWRHVCRSCSSPDHIDRECSFLSSITQN